MIHLFKHPQSQALTSSLTLDADFSKILEGQEYEDIHQNPITDELADAIDQEITRIYP